MVTRADNGNPQPNYSRLFGSLSSGAISNTYRGRKDGGFGLVASTGALHLAGYTADNLLREFVFRTITSKLPGYQKKTSADLPPTRLPRSRHEDSALKLKPSFELTNHTCEPAP